MNELSADIKRMKTRDNYIDLLKGIAILLVVLIHLHQNRECPNGILSKISMIGARAPQLFFVISAFLTWKTVVKREFSFKRFLLSRGLRIIPLYWLALIISMFIPTISIWDYSIGNIISHFLLVHGFNPWWINSILGVCWYIGDLVIFYLVCPLLKKMIRNLKTSLIVFGCSVGVSVLTLVVYNKFLLNITPELEMFFNTFCFIHQLPVLLLGIVVYYIIDYLNSYQKKWLVLVSWSVALCMFLAAFIFLNLNKRIITSSLVSGLVFSWVFVALNLFKQKLNGIVVIKPICFLGKHSYGVYLFHYTVILCVCLISFENSLLIWLCIYFIVIICSVLISLMMEWIQRKILGRYLM